MEGGCFNVASTWAITPQFCPDTIDSRMRGRAQLSCLPIPHMLRRPTAVLLAIFSIGILVGFSASSLHAAIRGSAIFRDVPVGHFADDAIGEMYNLGLIKGYDSVRFGPDDPVTRAQIAVLMKRLRDELRGSSISLSTSSSSSKSSSASAVSSSSSSSISSSSSSSSSSSAVATCSSNNPYNAGGYVHFGAKEYNVDKNDATGMVTIVVARTGGNQGAGTVDYAINTGTAVAEKDYVPMTGTLSFASKETSKKIQVKIKNNTADLAHRTVNMVLSNPQGAIKIDCPDRVLLKINDPRVASSSSSSSSGAADPATVIGFSASEYAVMENDASLTITVMRTGVTTAASTVNYRATDGTARSGTDYALGSGSFNFSAGETTKTFTVSIVDNVSIDGGRDFTLVLESPTGASVLAPTSKVLINDNESMTNGSGSIRYASSSFTVDASAGKALISVRHIAGTGPVSVSYATANGSAAAGLDYTATTGTLTFARGEATKIFSIPIVDRNMGELTVNLSLSNPVGAPLSDPATATLKLQ